jgi:predicted GIY-YIG superfamily endonuclease
LNPDKRYYVYIMASKSRVLYVGIGSLMTRILQHKASEIDGFTKRYQEKVALIRAANPTWEDLAEDWSTAIQIAKADSSLWSE